MKTQNIFLLLMVISLHGCFSEKHLEFENIPINGNLDEFVNELIKVGYAKPQLIKEDQIKLNGVFLDKNCEIYVYGAAKSHTAYKVRVNLPAEVQDSLEYSFDKLQKLYTSQFGSGTSKYQQFQNAERFLFNEPKRIRHLSQGDYTKYTTGSGVITIEVRDGYISITYLDKQNSVNWKREMGEEEHESID